MKLMGFNYSKINVEKFSGIANKNLKVSTNIDISSMNKVENNLLKGNEGLTAIEFEYNINYDPNVAKIEFKGNMILSLDSERTKQLLEEWQQKKIPEEVKIFLFNIILRKSNIKALQFEDELNLPLHMPVPKVSAQDKKEN